MGAWFDPKWAHQRSLKTPFVQRGFAFNLLILAFNNPFVSATPMKAFFCSLLFILLFQTGMLAEQNKIDSLLAKIKTAPADTSKAHAFADLSWEYIEIGDFEQALITAQEAFLLCEQFHETHGMAVAKNSMGVAHRYLGNYAEALKSHREGLKLIETGKDKTSRGGCLLNIGNIYNLMGNYPEALKNFLLSLKSEEAIGNKQGVAKCYLSIGIIYKKQGNYPEALKNYLRSQQLREELGDKKGIAESDINIGNIYADQGNHTKALEYYTSALQIFEKLGNKQRMAASYINIGSIYEDQRNYEKAVSFYLDALKIMKETGDKSEIANNMINLGTVYTLLRQYPTAKKYLEEGIALSKEIGYIETLQDGYQNASRLDSAMGNYAGAYKNYRLYVAYRDSLFNDESTKKLVESQMHYEFEKKEAAAKLDQDKKDAIAAEELKRQELQRNYLYGGLLLVIIFAGFIFSRYRITQKQKKIIELKNIETEKQKNTIAEQKEMVDIAFEQLHEKNKQVIDSINYASRIQKALTPSDKFIEAQLRRLKKNK